MVAKAIMRFTEEKEKEKQREEELKREEEKRNNRYRRYDYNYGDDDIGKTYKSQNRRRDEKGNIDN